MSCVTCDYRHPKVKGWFCEVFEHIPISCMKCNEAPKKPTSFGLLERLVKCKKYWPWVPIIGLPIVLFLEHNNHRTGIEGAGTFFISGLLQSVYVVAVLVIAGI